VGFDMSQQFQVSRVLLQALLESERANESRAALANRMGVDVAVLDSMVDDFNKANGEGAWAQLVVEQRIRADVTAANWDDLELEATQMLAKQVKSGKVTRIGDLLTIARTANMAARRGEHSRNTGPSGVDGDGTFGFNARLPSGEGVMLLRLGSSIASAIQNVQSAQSGQSGLNGQSDIQLNERLGPQPAAFETFNFKRIERPEELRQIAEADEGAGQSEPTI